jgi:hypothetical protein
VQAEQHGLELGVADAVQPGLDARRRGGRQVAAYRLRIESELRRNPLLWQPRAP